jgi:hypothetical protein
MVTLDAIKELEHPELTTLSSKVIYLMIEDRANEEGWASIGLKEFSSTASLKERAVINALHKLQASGLIEKRSRPGATNHYRIIN